MASACPWAAAKDDGWLPPEADPAAGERQRKINPTSLERVVFQSVGEEGDQRRRLEAELRLRIKRLGEVGGFDAAQAQRLRLAGRLDLRRFFDRYASAREAVSQALSAGEDPNAVRPIASSLQEQAAAGILGAGSTLAGVVKRVASDEQRVSLKRDRQARRDARYAAMVELGVMSLDRVMPLEAAERDALLSLAKTRTKAPNTFGVNNLYYLYYQFSRLPPDSIRRIVPGPRGEVLVELFSKGATYEAYLTGQGVYPYDEAP